MDAPAARREARGGFKLIKNLKAGQWPIAFEVPDLQFLDTPGNGLYNSNVTVNPKGQSMPKPLSLCTAARGLLRINP